MRNLIEISRSALTNNIKLFKKIIGRPPSSRGSFGTTAGPGDRLLGVAVKANAYGHGLLEAARVFVAAGADWLIVDSVEEGMVLRENGLMAPVLVVGYVPLLDLEKVFDCDLRLVVYNKQTVKKLEQIAKKRRQAVRVHLKIETGTMRQGIMPKEVIPLVRSIKSKLIEIEGASTHFANIEDVLEHDFAAKQLDTFKAMVELLKANKVPLKYIHCANSAATILFPKTYFNLVRIGISAYGLWPSQETKLSAVKLHRNQLQLEPAMAVKSLVAQVKEVPAGSFIGYGCTYKTTKKSKIAVVPIGYYDGYDRQLSNTAYVLIHGRRAPVRGRVCMNMLMADVSDIPNVRLEDPVILLGVQGKEEITAEQLAEWAGTINYEIVTRWRETLERKIVK